MKEDLDPILTALGHLLDAWLGCSQFCGALGRDAAFPGNAAGDFDNVVDRFGRWVEDLSQDQGLRPASAGGRCHGRPDGCVS